MAVCKSCKCDKKLCGCADKAQPVAPPCGQDTDYCPQPERCGEVFSANCVVYDGDTMVDANIFQGDRMDVILQKLVLWITNPTCIDTTGNCISPVGFRSTYISQSIVKLTWLPGTGASLYYVEYKLASAPSWTGLVPVPSTTTEYTITGLLPNSEYYMRVYSACPGSGQLCYSVTLSITTLPT